MFIDLNVIFITLIILLLLFLVCREVVTWYWKINRMVNTLDRIDSNLAYIAEILERSEGVPKSSEREEDTETLR